MASQQLIHHPLNTSITVLDTVSIPSDQYAFAFEILSPRYSESTLDFQPQPGFSFNMATPAVTNAITYAKNNFHYLLPAVLLNPILFLHALNAMLTAILPDLNIPHSTRTWFQPHLDINHNNIVATTYTMLIIVLQGFACQYCLDLSAKQVQRLDGNKTDDDYWQGD